MADWWSELTEAERRGARWLVLLLLLGTAHDAWRAQHPRLTPEPAGLQAVAAESVAVTGPPESPSAGAAGVDLNTATAAELDRLPGIGPVLAARIVEHRRRNGPFRSAEDLLSVPGIGPRLLERLRPGLRMPARAPR